MIPDMKVKKNTQQSTEKQNNSNKKSSIKYSKGTHTYTDCQKSIKKRTQKGEFTPKALDKEF